MKQKQINKRKYLTKENKEKHTFTYTTTKRRHLFLQKQSEEEMFKKRSERGKENGGRLEKYRRERERST